MEFFMCTIMTAAASFAFVLVIASHIEHRAIWKRAGIADEANGLPWFLRMLLPVAGRLRPRLARCEILIRTRRQATRLSAAGVESVSAADFFAARCMVAAAFGCWAAIVLPWGIAAFATGLAAGWAAPAIWLSARIRRRREEILLALPRALDWLTLSVEAGLDFAQALGRVTAHMPPSALREELCRLDAAMRMGTPRREAFASMAARADVSALSSFVSLLVQADALGTSIGPVLKAQGARLRAWRFSRAERKGVAAAQKALLPLALCIMPASFIVIFGPIIVRLAIGGIAALF